MELDTSTPRATRELRAELVRAAELCVNGGTPHFWWPARPALAPSAEAALVLAMHQFPPPHVCWLWRGHRSRDGRAILTKGDGFGRLRVLSSVAYRALYELLVDSLEMGKHLDHLCDRGTEGCANPFHCEQVSGVANSDRSRDRWQMHDVFVASGIVQARWSPSGGDEPFRPWEEVLQERGLPRPPEDATSARRGAGRLPKNRSLAAQARQAIRDSSTDKETET